MIDAQEAGLTSNRGSRLWKVADILPWDMVSRNYKYETSLDISGFLDTFLGPLVWFQSFLCLAFFFFFSIKEQEVWEVTGNGHRLTVLGRNSPSGANRMSCEPRDLPAKFPDATTLVGERKSCADCCRKPSLVRGRGVSTYFSAELHFPFGLAACFSWNEANPRIPCQHRSFYWNRKCSPLGPGCISGQTSKTTPFYFEIITVF